MKNDFNIKFVQNVHILKYHFEGNNILFLNNVNCYVVPLPCNCFTLSVDCGCFVVDIIDDTDPERTVVVGVDRSVLHVNKKQP